MSSFQGRESPRIGIARRATTVRDKNNRQPRRDRCRRQAAICEAAQTYCRTPPFSRIAARVASIKLITCFSSRSFSGKIELASKKNAGPDLSGIAKGEPECFDAVVC
jgi:hypothetical protein